MCRNIRPLNNFEPPATDDEVRAALDEALPDDGIAVLNADHIGHGEFHGAKFYRHLAEHDMSNHFLDVVSAQFDVVRDAVARVGGQSVAVAPAPTV